MNAQPASQARSRNLNSDQSLADERENASPSLYSSDALFGDQRLVHIQHRGAIYRLQITRSEKLILTK